MYPSYLLPLQLSWTVLTFHQARVLLEVSQGKIIDSQISINSGGRAEEAVALNSMLRDKHIDLIDFGFDSGNLSIRAKTLDSPELANHYQRDSTLKIGKWLALMFGKTND